MGALEDGGHAGAAGPRRRTAPARGDDRAREGLGATALFLGSNSKLGSAVHLYEQFGFQHVEPDTLHMPYERANVFMRLELRGRLSALIDAGARG